MAKKTQAKEQDEKKNLTPEEKAILRELALMNLQKRDLVDIASAAYVDSDKRYGEADGNVVDAYVYRLALGKNIPTYYDQNGQKIPLFEIDPTKSRIKGKRYTGRIEISEQQILDKAQQIVNDSLVYAKVADIAGLVGYKGKIERYGDEYILDLLQSDNEEAKNIATALVLTYQAYIKDTAVIKGFTKEREALIGGLERILNPNVENK